MFVIIAVVCFVLAVVTAVQKDALIFNPMQWLVAGILFALLAGPVTWNPLARNRETSAS